MKKKEMLGIVIGIAFLGLAVFSFIISSKDDQKGRTVPVARLEWEQVKFANPELQKVVEDLQLRDIKGFLFQKDSQTPMYFHIYVGKSARGSDAVNAYFPGSKPVEPGLMKREESAMKLLGVEKPAILSGKKIGNQIDITHIGDFVIISFVPQSTNVVLNQLQMEHFMHRYFKLRETPAEDAAAKPQAAPEEKK